MLHTLLVIVVIAIALAFVMGCFWVAGFRKGSAVRADIAAFPLPAAAPAMPDASAAEGFTA